MVRPSSVVRCGGRRQFIRDAVRGGIAHVAEVGGHIVGYAVLEHSFFERGFIAMLIVQPDHLDSGDPELFYSKLVSG